MAVYFTKEMTESSNSLVRFVSQVASAPGGVSLGSGSGSMIGVGQTISRNSEYFAYASHSSIFIYKLPEFVQVETICSNKDSNIKHMRLSPGKQTELIFITADANFVHCDFIEHTMIRELDLTSWMTRGQFTTVEFCEWDWVAGEGNGYGE